MPEKTVTQLLCSRKSCGVTAICIQEPSGEEVWPDGWAHCHVGKWSPPNVGIILCPNCWTDIFSDIHS